ncbi:hypothetical protein BDU57DRAFT_517830 [Ampelomyces quisqualis]|uniref:Methyltransferase domain-containing protein n=1 Tax=Ampelomyces quisqualis TaxID=50730 RepID=A0A6A5QK30_AMPQU|nr:hypothetical protein BDU57DRAFT_517830 [Ampelomyces quisqualis]
MPPSYGSQEYWNQRFKSESEPFEWLEAPHMLDPFLHDALSATKDPRPKILHIGCGTSELSYHLQTLVATPDQIHNLDYSDIAIDLGRKREKELCGMDRFEDYHILDGATRTCMKWDTVDMLNHKSLLGACKPGEYSIIVDKSTADCIACTEDVRTPLPYPVDVPSQGLLDLSVRETPEPLHPLHILAVHLALVARPGARWIALSYSEDRFPFVDGLYSSRPHIPGFPDTGSLWKLLDKHEIDGGRAQQTTYTNAVGTIVHQPKVLHWVYIMQRTEVPLAIRGAHL